VSRLSLGILEAAWPAKPTWYHGEPSIRVSPAQQSAHLKKIDVVQIQHWKSALDSPPQSSVLPHDGWVLLDSKEAGVGDFVKTNRRRALSDA
jgi:hypothetical protein